MTAPPEPPEGPDVPIRVRHLDADALRVLAQPLRVRLVGQLRVHGPATATMLAERLGESSGLTSYHLRVLERAGFVEDAADVPRRGRERWWRSVDDMTSWRADDAGGDPDSQAAEEWLTAFAARQAMGWIDAWLAQRPQAPEAWRVVAEQSDYHFDLSPAELADLLAEVGTVLASRLGWRRDDAHPDREPVQLLLHAFPSQIHDRRDR
jgi:DNA-binding transcriptional ArsR family regulator